MRLTAVFCVAFLALVTGCVQLPPAVKDEMRPSPSDNHFARKVPADSGDHSRL